MFLLHNKLNFCRDLKCKDPSLTLKDLAGGEDITIKPADNTTNKVLAKRVQDCELSMVGKPVFHNHLDMKYGAWLRDPIKKEKISSEKIWLTFENETKNLYEYKNRNELKKNIKNRQAYKLDYAFQVTKVAVVNVENLFDIFTALGKWTHCLR